MDTITTRLVDIHNHTLPFVDDGAKDFEDAVSNLEYLKNIGVTDVILTSHYIEKSNYKADVKERNEILTELQKLAKNFGINLYLGNEVYITDEDTLLSLLKEEKITTLNNSRYLLIEFPLWQKVSGIDRVICALNEKGIIPIIAHPERYSYIQKDFNKIYDLLEYDCLLQCNIYSYAGKYGRAAKKTIKKLLKEELVSFLATDLHKVPSSDSLLKAKRKLEKKLDSTYYRKLTIENPEKVLNNKSIKGPEVGYYK